METSMNLMEGDGLGSWSEAGGGGNVAFLVFA